MALLRKLKIKVTLGLGFGLLLLVTLIITIIGIINMWIVDTGYTYKTDRAAMLMLGTLGVGSLLAGILIAVLITKAITNPVKTVGTAKTVMLNNTVNTIQDTIWRQHQIYNANPIPGSLWDSNANAIDCNEAIVKLLEMPDKTDYINKAKFFDFSPEYQPDGISSKEKVPEIFREAREKGRLRFTWMHQTAKKELVPCDVTMVRINFNDKCIFAVYLQDLRPLREADAKIREAEQLNEIFLGASPFIMNIWDEDINLVSTSQQSVKMFGLSSKKQYTDHFFDLSPTYQPCGTPSTEKALACVRQAFRDGSVKFEWMHQTLNHEPIPAEITIVRFEHQGKHFAAAYTVDLRPAKAAMEKERQLEMKLRELEMNERILLMFDATPLMIEYWDRNYNAIECNKTTLEYYRYSSKEDYKKNQVKSSLYPDDASVWNKHLEEIFEAGFGSFEFMEKKPNNDTVFMKVDAIRMKYNGDLVVVTYSNDVTQLKEKEQAVTQAREALEYRDKLLNTVNQAAEALLTANEEDTMKALMKGMEIVGRCLDVDRVQIWRNEEIGGELYFVMCYQWLSTFGKQKRIFPVGLSKPYSERPGWLEIFLKGESINTPIAKLPPDEAALLHHYEMISIANLPLFLNKEFVGFFSIADCRQERVFTSDEMDIVASAGLMFTAVINRNVQADRIAEANRKLESALEYALAASRAKSDFLSVMSHEMRTPMNAIIGMTTIAQNERDNKRKSYALSKVEKAAHHLLGIINDVLDMSKIEANKMELQYAEFDLRILLQKTTSLVGFRIDEKQHRFSMNLAENVPSFYNGDEQRLAQILINLLSNAAMYTPEGGEISLDIALVKKEEQICELRFEVADNGIGISPEQRERIFGMFERGDSSTNRKYGGTGLGLAISKRLIELMGGAISIESAPGKGSRFIFTVKLPYLEKIEGNVPNSDAASSSSTANIKFTGKRLLLAEDIEINREILIAQLEGTELLIDIAQNGKEALEKIKANPDSYDLVFMDMQMPEMDGIEATRAIRSLPANASKRLPIIAMTANVFADDIEKCLRAGMNDHIGKPLDMHTVYEKLAKYLL